MRVWRLLSVEERKFSAADPKLRILNHFLFNYPLTRHFASNEKVARAHQSNKVNSVPMLRYLEPLIL